MLEFIRDLLGFTPAVHEDKQAIKYVSMETLQEIIANNNGYIMTKPLNRDNITLRTSYKDVKTSNTEIGAIITHRLYSDGTSEIV